MGYSNKKIELITNFVKEKQNSVIRINGNSLFNHVYRVFTNINSLGINDESTLVLALTHHLRVSDLEEYPDIFNKIDISLLQQFHEFKKNEFKFEDEKELSKSNIFEAIFKLIKNKEILLVRIADKTEDIKTAYSLNNTSRINSAKRAMYLYAPLAKLTGLRQSALILQEYAFRILDPRNYYLTQRYIEDLTLKKKDVLGEVVDLIKLLLHEKNVNHDIHYRYKSNFSTFIKYKSRNLQKANDIFALRILVDNVVDCYIVEDILNSLFEMDNSQRADYISKPKQSGYKSLHLVIKIDLNTSVEIQIRTFDMHRFNEYGEASHIFYKFKDINLKKYIEMDPNWLESVDFLNSNIEWKIDINRAEIFVFTPKDQIYKLPVGSNTLDFAYAIHEELGNCYKGALVNEKIANLDYKLQDGDKVEILTSSKATVNMDWLDKVESIRAKRLIKRALAKSQD